PAALRAAGKHPGRNPRRTAPAAWAAAPGPSCPRRAPPVPPADLPRPPCRPAAENRCPGAAAAAAAGIRGSPHSGAAPRRDGGRDGLRRRSRRGSCREDCPYALRRTTQGFGRDSATAFAPESPWFRVLGPDRPRGDRGRGWRGAGALPRIPELQPSRREVGELAAQGARDLSATEVAGRDGDRRGAGAAPAHPHIPRPP